MSWANKLTGLNTSRDKMMYGLFESGVLVDDETADRLYTFDDVAARVCDALPEYALRKPPQIRITPEEEVAGTDINETLRQLDRYETDIYTALEDLGAVEKIADSLVWGNVYGAGVLLPVIDDGAKGDQLREPLNEDRIRSIKALNVIDKRYLTPIKWYSDPNKPKFGEPEIYIITPFAVTSMADIQGIGETSNIYEIHETRLIMFGGVRTTVRQRQQNNGWRNSLLTRGHQVLRQFGMSWDMLPHLIQDANQGVFKMHGLIDALAADAQGDIAKRMELMDMSRSVLRALTLDAETEDFQRQNFSWTGLEKPFDLLMYRLSLAFRVPVSILMGRSPAGMNATGDHDWEGLIGQVEAYQTYEVRPGFSRLVHLLCKSSEGPTGGEVPENLEISFPPLRSLAPKEEAERNEIQARADKHNIEMGVYTSEEAALSRFGREGFSADTTIDISARFNNELDDPTMGSDGDAPANTEDSE